MAYTEMGLSVFLLLLSLTPPFAFASASASVSGSDGEPHVLDYVYPGYCPSASSRFQGLCVPWREGECNSICINVEHKDFGECFRYELVNLKCLCYRKCGPP
ncbi:hypothetical protein SUGI_0547120 [Cryptomeria japonica]|nr:hypothetical protein SUGI_0547120 [Cryptomeria japonica]